MVWNIGIYMLKKINKYLLLILGLALLVRLLGISHGFPFIFHPDEPTLIRTALGLRYNLNPDHYDWPTMHMYLNLVIYGVFIKSRAFLQVMNLQGSVESLFPILWRDPLIFYYISRTFNAILGAFTVIPVYLAAKYLFQERAALYAALIMALMPFHVYTSHFALIDVPSAFWVAWALYFTCRILYERNFHYYILAGLIVGFAASTKYNGGLIAPMIGLAHLLRVWHSPEEKLLDKEGLLMLFYSGLFAFLGFVLGTPYSILDYETFSETDSPKGAYWQFTNVGSVDLVTQFQQFLEVSVSKISDDVGYTAIIAYFGSAFFFFDVLIKAIVEKKKKKISHNILKVALVLMPSLFVIFHISGFETPRSQYYITVYPFIALLAGFVVEQTVITFNKKKKTKKYLNYFLFGFFVFPVVLTVGRVYTLLRLDTRQVVYHWMQENVTPEDTIYYDTSSLRPVLEKFRENETEKYTKNRALEGSGYILVSLEPDEIEHTLDVSEVSSLVLYVNNTLRLGPNLGIYRYDKQDQQD